MVVVNTYSFYTFFNLIIFILNLNLGIVSIDLLNFVHCMKIINQFHLSITDFLVSPKKKERFDDHHRFADAHRINYSEKILPP